MICMEDMRGRILIIDDDAEICKALQNSLNLMGHKATYKLNLKDGISEVSSSRYDVIFLDVCLPDGNGLNELPKIAGNESLPEIIIMTGDGAPDGAEIAIKNGAWDYIEKPLTINSLILSLKRALQYRKEKNASRSVSWIRRENIVGDSLPLKRCIDLLGKAADSDTNVLITGETGTGKELFASAIHHNSVRKDKNFVIVDCAALPETLVESVLFGHEKGAYTGAEKARDGLIRQADGGTLFLDEIGELPYSIQSAFLRVLQERKFRPIGGKGEIESDFRLITATNRDLDHMVKDGGFRRELVFRIRSMVIDLPPLRDRDKDINILIIHFIKKICEQYRIPVKNFSPEFLEVLIEYRWPGNVRELVNTLENAINNARYEPTLFPKHLPVHLRIHVARNSVINNSHRNPQTMNIDNVKIPGEMPTMKSFRARVIAENEKKYLQEVISLTSGDINRACKISGLGRARLYGLMKRYGISKNSM